MLPDQIGVNSATRRPTPVDSLRPAKMAPEAVTTRAVSGPVKDGARCGDCLHESDDACNHPMVMADPKVEKNEHGDAIVHDGNCCKYWKPRDNSVLEGD